MCQLVPGHRTLHHGACAPGSSDLHIVTKLTIDSRNQDTKKHFSRLDFHIVNCTNVVLLVECDEMQHQWYNLSYEMARMVDVRAALILAGYTLPIYSLLSTLETTASNVSRKRQMHA